MRSWFSIASVNQPCIQDFLDISYGVASALRDTLTQEFFLLSLNGLVVFISSILGEMPREILRCFNMGHRRMSVLIYSIPDLTHQT